MSITTLEKLKSYFKTGSKPTQEQFHALLDSFIHKGEDTSYILQGLAGATFMGVATPDSVPPVPTQKVFYVANEVGTYPNYGGLSVADGEIAFFTYNGSWSKVALEDVARKSEVDEKFEKITGRQVINEANWLKYHRVITSDNATIADGMCYGNVGENPSYTISGIGRSHVRVEFSTTELSNNIIIRTFGAMSSLGSDILLLDVNNIIIDKYSMNSNSAYKDVNIYIPSNCVAVEIPYTTSAQEYVNSFHCGIMIIPKSEVLQPKKITARTYIKPDGSIGDNITTQTLYYYDVTNIQKVQLLIRFYTGDTIPKFAFYDSNSIFNSNTLIEIDNAAMQVNRNSYNYICENLIVPKNAKTLIAIGRDVPTCCMISPSDLFINELVEYKDDIQRLNPSDYVFTRGLPQGNVGEEISINTNAQWGFYSIPWDDKYDIMCFQEPYSSLGAYVLQVDSENKIVFSKPCTRNAEKKIAINKVNGATNVIYPIPFGSTVGFDLFKAKTYQVYPTVPTEKFAFSMEGKKQTFVNLRSVMIDVSTCGYVYADIRDLSGGNAAVFTYIDENKRIIKTESKMTVYKTDGYVYSVVPDLAKYVYIAYRDYITDGDIYYPKFYVSNKIAQIKNETMKSVELATHSYVGEIISFPHYTCEVVGNGVIQSYITNPNNEKVSGQGCAIWNNTLFRLHDKGYTTIYDISNLKNITQVNEFNLGSSFDINHANCGQFSNIFLDGNTIPLLYIAGITERKCYVENINLDNSSSTLVQTITFNCSLSDNYGVMMQVGDDGYLYACCCGVTTSDRTRYFYKFHLPQLTTSEVVLNEEDAIDSWQISASSYNESQTQGLKIYNNKVYWLGGASSYYDDGVKKRELNVFDNINHKLISRIDLTNVIDEEPEDWDIVDGKILIVVNGENAKFAYLLNI